MTYRFLVITHVLPLRAKSLGDFGHFKVGVLSFVGVAVLLDVEEIGVHGVLRGVGVLLLLTTPGLLFGALVFRIIVARRRVVLHLLLVSSLILFGLGIVGLRKGQYECNG